MMISDNMYRRNQKRNNLVTFGSWAIQNYHWFQTSSDVSKSNLVVCL